MTEQREPWYLDRLRAELERVAAIEDQRERGPALGRLRPALGRLRPSPQTLVALAMVLALVAVVLAVARVSDVERPVAPQPSPAAGPQGACVPSRYWKAPIVDEPIPQAIASDFAIFRDPPPSGELPRDLPNFGAKRLYRGAVTLRPRLDTGARLRVVLIAADTSDADLRIDQRDWCAPPPDPIVPGICFAVFLPDGMQPEGFLPDGAQPEHRVPYMSTWRATHPNAFDGTGGCYSLSSEIEPAQAWLPVARQTIFGLAPDGVDRVTFDRGGETQGPQSLNVTENVFAGEMRWAQQPGGALSRFTPSCARSSTPGPDCGS